MEDLQGPYRIQINNIHEDTQILSREQLKDIVERSLKKTYKNVAMHYNHFPQGEQYKIHIQNRSGHVVWFQFDFHERYLSAHYNFLASIGEKAGIAFCELLIKESLKTFKIDREFTRDQLIRFTQQVMGYSYKDARLKIEDADHIYHNGRDFLYRFHTECGGELIEIVGYVTANMLQNPFNLIKEISKNVGMHTATKGYKFLLKGL